MTGPIAIFAQRRWARPGYAGMAQSREDALNSLRGRRSDSEPRVIMFTGLDDEWQPRTAAPDRCLEHVE